MNYIQQHFSQFTQQNPTPPGYLQAQSNQLTSPYPYDMQSHSPGAMTLGEQPSHSFHSQIHQSNQHTSQMSGASATNIDDQRKQDILKKLQQEREMRRQYVQEGRANEFQLQTLSQGGNTGLASARGGSTIDARDQYSIQKEQIPDQHQMYMRHGMMSEQLNSQRHGGSEIRVSYDRLTDFGGNQPDNVTDHSRMSLDNRKELVHKLLQDRKANKSRSSISNQSVSYTQQPVQQESYRQQQYQEYSASPVQDNFGGFNPEALYQEDVIQQYEDDRQKQMESFRNQPMQQDMNHTSQSSSVFGNTQSYDDQKYRDAVEYAKAQIQREMQKKQQQRNQGQYNENLVSYPSDRMSAVIHQINPNHRERDDSNPPEPQQRIPQTHWNQDYSGLPPSVKHMDKQIASKSTAKALEEMNHKHQRQSKGHHFNYESEDDQQLRHGCIGKKQQFKRPTSATARAGPPEYLKNTVAADLKKGENPTINKTKQIVGEHQKKFQEEHTFKPNIIDYPLPPSKEMSKEERWKKLTEPKTGDQQKRERIKAQIEIEETQKQCTFKPSITSTKSAKKQQINNPLYELPLQERLLHEADLRKEKREKLKREQEMHQMKDCSFKPKILGTSQSLINMNKFNTQTPIHERVGDLQKEKNEKLQKLRMLSEQEQSDLTFQPQVNKKSSKIAHIKNEDDRGTVVDRLYKDANERIEKHMQHTVSVNEQQNKEYSFQPHISKSSNYMSEKSDMFNGNLKDFYDRQQAFVQKQLEKREEQKQKYSQEAKCSFHPEINVTSEIIVESDPNRGVETDDQRVMRLYKKDMKRQEVVREMVEREVYDQYTYKPQINKISRTLAKGASIDELAYNPKGREKKERLQEEILIQEVTNCTFRPQTTKNKKYKEVQSNYSMNDCANSEEYSKKLKDKLKEKQERIAQERRQREYDQMRDCTFKPTIMDKEPSTAKDQVVVVRGLGRHLELKELQKKKEEDRKLREAEVFGLNHKFAVYSEELDITNPGRQQLMGQPKNPGAYTIPQPFDLSHVKDDKRHKVLKEMKEKEMTECTFKPSTNEGRNKKLIRELLNDQYQDKENGLLYINH